MMDHPKFASVQDCSKDNDKRAQFRIRKVIDVLSSSPAPHFLDSNKFLSPVVTISSVLILFISLLGVGEARERQRYPQEQDPNSQYICRGELQDYAACQCKEEEGELACINAQFVDTEIFLNVNNHYKSLQKITFHGNNFQDLPPASLFGGNNHNRLLTLNISANYIVNLNSNALKGLPNLRVLDLSNNEIVLKQSDVDFLSHTPHLTELYLRRAFTQTINRTIQFNIMMEMFRRAQLHNLQVLDLSYNFLSSVPFDLPCPFPSLSHLDLRQNFLKTLTVNSTCLSTVSTIDLSRNQFYSLTPSFRQLANRCRSDSIILRNPFHCDCNSKDYVTWLRSTNVIRNKNTLVCDRASPRSFVGTRLVEVPIHKLDCTVNLLSMGGPTLSKLILFFLFAGILF